MYVIYIIFSWPWFVYGPLYSLPPQQPTYFTLEMGTLVVGVIHYSLNHNVNVRKTRTPKDGTAKYGALEKKADLVSNTLKATDYTKDSCYLITLCIVSYLKKCAMSVNARSFIFLIITQSH